MRPFPSFGSGPEVPGTHAIRVGSTTGQEKAPVEVSMGGSPIILVLGVRGSGKSTLVRCIAHQTAQIGCPTLVMDFQGNWRLGSLPAGDTRPVQRLLMGPGPLRDYLPVRLPIGVLTVDDFAALLGLGTSGKSPQCRLLASAIESLGAEWSLAELISAAEGLAWHQGVASALISKVEHLQRLRILSEKPVDQPLDLDAMDGLTILDVATAGMDIQTSVGLVVGRLVAAWARQRSFAAGGLSDLPRMVLVLDEAQRCFSDPSASVAWQNLALSCREWGVSVVAATQRPAAMPPGIRTQAEVVISGELRHGEDLRAACDLFCDCPPSALRRALTRFTPGQFYGRGLVSSPKRSVVFKGASAGD